MKESTNATTEDLDGEGDAESNGGIVTCASKYADDLGELAELFAHKAALREAARFAMAVGIRANLRLPRSEWGKGKPRNIAHLHGQFDDRRHDFELLFQVLKIRDHTLSLNNDISEYISGGMQWLVEHEVHKGENFSSLKEAFPDLFMRSAAE
jgi:hypothetical protein